MTTAAVLNCNATKTYCIGWRSDLLTVTEGDSLDYRPLVSWQDDVPTPTYAVSVKMGLAKGVIEFNQNTGN